MSARTDVKVGEVFHRGVMRMTALAMPGKDTLSEVEIIEAVPVEMIDASPLNRTEFDKTKTQEMEDSLREHGQTTAAIVRPKPDGRLELVAGERRWRGCQAIGMPTLNCVVRTYSDAQAAEILLIENLEREDLKPTEQARIYQNLLSLKDADGRKLYTLERIAERVHNDIKKVTHVARVLSILDLPKPLKTALDAGEVPLRVAYVVARIADEEDRKAAGEKVMKGEYGEGPMTTVKAIDFVSRHFQVSLKGTSIDKEDADILPAALKAEFGFTGARGEANDGSCERCPWLAKNHPIFQSELSTNGAKKERTKGVDPMTCTRAKCHEAKLEAMWQSKAVPFAAKHGAQRVLSRDESREARGYLSKYVLLEAQPTGNDLGDWSRVKEAPTWEKLIKGKGVPLLVAQDDEESEGCVLVLERELAMEAGRAARPDLFAAAKQAGQSGAKVVLSDEEIEEQRAQELARKVEHAVEARLKREALVALLESIQEGGLSIDGMRALFDSISRNVDHLGTLATWVLPDHTDDEEWPEAKGREYLEAMNPDGVLALCAVATVMDDVHYSGVDRAEDFIKLAQAQGIDLKTLRKQVAKDVKRKLDAEAKAAVAAEKEATQRKNRNAMEEIQKRTVLEEGKVEVECEPAAAVPVLEVVKTEKADFAQALMGLTVLPTAPNESGVFTSPLVVTYKRGKVWCSIKLACDEGHWYVGYQYGGKPVEKVNSGGGLPKIDWPHATRLEAVLDELEAMIDHLEAPFNSLIEDFKDVRVMLEGAEAETSTADDRAALQEKCAAWREANPGQGAMAMADALGVDKDLAFEIVDELIDEDYAAQAEAVAGMRAAKPDEEKLAWESYLETGSIAEAAKAAGVAVDTVKNWHKRRGWKGLRAAELGV
jgi:ParB/RepB/Spo0J family partition protein